MLRGRPLLVRPTRGLSSSSSSALGARMKDELRNVLSAASKATGKQLPQPPPPPPPAAGKKAERKPFVRRMRDHVLPPYVEANFRTMQFVLTRAPKVADFPREKVYKPESIDLLFRHYYMNRRA